MKIFALLKLATRMHQAAEWSAQNSEKQLPCLNKKNWNRQKKWTNVSTNRSICNPFVEIRTSDVTALSAVFFFQIFPKFNSTLQLNTQREQIFPREQVESFIATIWKARGIRNIQSLDFDALDDLCLKITKARPVQRIEFWAWNRCRSRWEGAVRASNLVAVQTSSLKIC